MGAARLGMIGSGEGFMVMCGAVRPGRAGRGLVWVSGLS